MKETKEQKIERIAVGLAVDDKLVEIAMTKSIAEFLKKYKRHRSKRKFDSQLTRIDYSLPEFWKTIKKMKNNPDYNNPDKAYDDEPAEDEKP